MNADKELVVRFRPPYSNRMYYIECDFVKQAEKLQDWLREKGAEANIGFIKKQFNYSSE